MLLLKVFTFKFKTVSVWMIHFMITLAISPEPNKTPRGHEGHPADVWTNSYMNNGQAHSKCHSLSIITSEISPFVRMNKSVNRKVLCKQ